jgi:hypothetical protein
MEKSQTGNYNAYLESCRIRLTVAPRHVAIATIAQLDPALVREMLVARALNLLHLAQPHPPQPRT